MTDQIDAPPGTLTRATYLMSQRNPRSEARATFFNLIDKASDETDEQRRRELERQALEIFLCP